MIQVARGQKPADLILANARIVNVFNGEIEQGNIAIYAGRIAGTGDYSLSLETLDLKGQYVLPGLIDGHTHIESSLLDIAEYARAVIPHGTLGVVTDLHEITNVCGMAGIDYILKASRRLPFEFFVMAPSCVPATHLETAGANFDATAIRRLLKRSGVIGLGEMMNYPGVLFGDANVLTKINAASDMPVDGHSPGLNGLDLNAYISCGISSDHECVALAEAREKLARGMYIMIREGSSEKNLEALLPLVTDKTYKRCLFVVDDRSCTDILHDGDIDAVVRKASNWGWTCAGYSTGDHQHGRALRIEKHGAVAPGYLANLIVMPDLKRFEPKTVLHRGNVVAREGKPLFKTRTTGRQGVNQSVNVKPFKLDDLKLKAGDTPFPVIEVVPGQIITRRLDMKALTDKNGFIVSDVERDMLKAVVVERHGASGNTGRGLVKGFGLKSGAIASSVAHDSHNIVAVGTSDEDILTAIKEIVSMQGGLAVVEGGRVLAGLPLPVAGLMSDRPLGEVVDSFARVEETAKKLGCTLAAPFATLSFIALPVIPELRLTDLGLVDVNAFKIIRP
jgi:adenine deaminase